MAYHGYLPLLKQYIHQLPHSPAIIEIGVDRGVSFIPLLAFMARAKKEFLAIGIDIIVQDAVSLIMRSLDLQPKQSAYLIEGNSLQTLPKIIDQKMKFDVVLLDGDHNYHTVSSEMKMIESIINDTGIILIDDYDGRWSEKDLWYAERPGYEENKLASQKVNTEKHGVKLAVDEWLSSHSEWKLLKPIKGEPVMLMKQPPEELIK